MTQTSYPTVDLSECDCGCPATGADGLCSDCRHIVASDMQAERYLYER